MDRANGINDAGLVVGDRGGNNIATTWTASGGYHEVRRLDGTISCCSSLIDVNASGDAAGWSHSDRPVSSMVWSQATDTKTDLLIPERAYASSINDGGDVVGYHFNLGYPFVAYFKPQGGVPITLAQRPGTVNAYAWAINNAGTIVGENQLGADVGYPIHAVVWPSPSAVPTDLGTLGGPNSHAYGVNQVGDVVGSAEIAGGVMHAFLWTSGGGMVDLTSWPSPCAGPSEARSVNDLGIIVGTCNGGPVFWTAVQGMRTLPLPSGVTRGLPMAINNQNQVVGIYNGFGGALWTIVLPNAPPVAAAGGPYTGTEGSDISLGWSASDSDGDALSYSWSFGDGTSGSGSSLPSSHTYADDGSYTLSVSATDGSGASHSATATATVFNAAPVVGIATVPIAPLALLAGGNVVNISAPFSDVGASDSFTAITSCDGGSGTTRDLVAGSTSATGTCTFTAVGVYSVTLTVLDDDGGEAATAVQFVVVYDPTAGFVIGGGWIPSLAGAYADGPALSGKATFGFVSKYVKGATQPTGNTEFNFHVGSFTFSSTVYDWLVVSGPLAQFKGEGTVNGLAGYSFLLTATDGQLGGGGGIDKFRIKVWETTTGRIAYDNATGSDDINSSNQTALGGGSISIKAR